jgi:hypothetical protein
MTAHVNKPNLVYSYKEVKLPRQSSQNEYKGRAVYLCWAEDGAKDVAIKVLPSKVTDVLIKDCINARKKRKKTMYTQYLYETLQNHLIQEQKERLERQAKAKVKEQKSIPSNVTTQKTVLKRNQVIQKEVTKFESKNKEVAPKELESELNNFIKTNYNKVTNEIDIRVVNSSDDKLLQSITSTLKESGYLFSGLQLAVRVPKSKLKVLDDLLTDNFKVPVSRTDMKMGTIAYFSLIGCKSIEEYKGRIRPILTKLSKENSGISDNFVRSLSTKHVQVGLEYRPEAIKKFTTDNQVTKGILYILDICSQDLKGFESLNNSKDYVSGYISYTGTAVGGNGKTLLFIGLTDEMSQSYIEGLTKKVNSYVDLYYYQSKNNVA